MTTSQPGARVGWQSIAELGEAITAAMPSLDDSDHRIAVAIYRLMSHGEPITLAAIADAAGATPDQVKAKLDSWPGVFKDKADRVVGFWGYAIAKLDPEYELVAEGKTTYAWCALDTLFIPGVLGKAVRVEASDPITGKQVSLVVDREGTREVSPAGARVSMLVPEGRFGYDVIESFCHRVLFFESEETGGQWTARHPGATLLSVDEAFQLGRALTFHITGVTQQ